MSPARALLDALRRVAEAGKLPSELLVAYSGGLDSTCLLACAAETRSLHGLPIRALHVDHGWAADSHRWGEFCVENAGRLGIACDVHRLAGSTPVGQSPEAWARERRYAVLETAMPAGGAVLTAHHEGDQAETFLLMALRGSGPRGLAGIAPWRAFGPGLLLRPFLDTPREALVAFVQARALRWLEDPSNANDAFDRNFLRTRVLPLLAARWPAATVTLARSARWQRALAQTEADVEADLLANTSIHAVLPVGALAERATDDALRLLRAWIRARGVPVPGAALLLRVLREMLPAPEDRQPVVRWQRWSLRRYRDALHLTLACLPALHAEQSWQWTERLDLPGGTLRATTGAGEGIALRALRGRLLQVRARRGGEQFRPAGDHHRRSLKHLWQDAGTPPWQRARTPLVYLGETLIAVPGLGHASEFAAADGEPSVLFQWQPQPDLP